MSRPIVGRSLQATVGHRGESSENLVYAGPSTSQARTYPSSTETHQQPAERPHDQLEVSDVIPKHHQIIHLVQRAPVY